MCMCNRPYQRQNQIFLFVSLIKGLSTKQNSMPTVQAGMWNCRDRRRLGPQNLLEKVRIQNESLPNTQSSFRIIVKSGVLPRNTYGEPFPSLRN